MRPIIYENKYCRQFIKFLKERENPVEPDGTPMSEDRLLELARGYATATTCAELLWPIENRQSFEWYNSAEYEEKYQAEKVLYANPQAVEAFIQENGRRDSSREAVVVLIKRAIENAQKMEHDKPEYNNEN